MNLKVLMIKKALLVVGVSLLILNTVGLFTSLSNKAILSEQETVFKNDVKAVSGEYPAETKIRENEERLDYLLRMNTLVNNYIAYYWEDAGKSTYNLQIPITENYILWMAGYVFPEHYAKYEFANYWKAFDRGVGLCSQHAIILTGILNDNNIPAKIISLSGHVVTYADTGVDNWNIFDSNYGVFIPHTLEEAENNPKMVKDIYKNSIADYREVDEPISLEEMAAVYGTEGNQVYEDGIRGYVGFKKYYIEKGSYWAIWLFPLLLLLFHFRYPK
ncbi:MAG TPA: hypothetical protein EYN51_08605 [Flavobacteriales bacterium]|nr:hypothetical protein [Flavobacteriales bacterium]HIA12304.1 hypothetical protein [Flavobacteriales bacterium]